MTDKLCFVLALAAIIFGLLTKEPLVALAISVLADIIASIPTIVKTYRDPYSEAVFPWFLVIVALLGAISTIKLNTANLIYPFYMLVMDHTDNRLRFLRTATQNEAKNLGVYKITHILPVNVPR